MLAKRSLGKVTLRYQVNGGRIQSGSTSEWSGGERYGVGNDVYYHVVGGQVTGTQPGDSVKVWFTGGREQSGSFTYRVVSDTGRRVLIVAAEDYSGASPVQPPGPHFLSYYANALAANGVAFDVYDVDANGRTAPDNLGVLSHYDAVVWYTGNDVVTRETGWGPGNASRLAMQELLEVRDFVNEGGRVLYAGKAPASSTPRVSARSSTTRSRTGSAAPTRPYWHAAWRCPARATARATRSSTVRRRHHHAPTAGSIPTRATRSASTASTTRSPA